LFAYRSSIVEQLQAKTINLKKWILISNVSIAEVFVVWWVWVHHDCCVTAFKPINTSLYLCDNKFHTAPLSELLEVSQMQRHTLPLVAHLFPLLFCFVQSDERFGFIVMDGSGTLFGAVSGSAREVLHKVSVSACFVVFSLLLWHQFSLVLSLSSLGWFAKEARSWWSICRTFCSFTYGETVSFNYLFVFVPSFVSSYFFTQKIQKTQLRS